MFASILHGYTQWCCRNHAASSSPICKASSSTATLLASSLLSFVAADISEVLKMFSQFVLALTLMSWLSCILQSFSWCIVNKILFRQSIDLNISSILQRLSGLSCSKVEDRCWKKGIMILFCVFKRGIFSQKSMYSISTVISLDISQRAF